MDIENYCIECDDQENYMDDLSDTMSNCNVNNEQITVYISSILEKLIKEMNYTKDYDEEQCTYTLNITPPMWFNSIDVKYQNILIKLIEPTLKEYLNKH